MAVTDGATRSSTTQVDPGGRESAWESVLADGISATGIDPGATFDTPDDPAASTPQYEDGGSSAGSGVSGSPAAPAASSTGDDGTPKAASTATKPVSPTSASEPTDPASNAATPETDPLAGAEPFTYTVGTETRTMDGAFRIPGEGLYVPEDKVPQFQLIASRAETLDRENRKLYEDHAALTRQTTWQIKDAQGERTLTGGEAIRHLHLDRAYHAARADAITDALNDPETFRSLVGVDEAGNIVLNPSAITNLDKDIKLRSMQYAGGVLSHMGKVSAPPPPPAPNPGDFATSTIKSLIDTNKIAGLTAEDVQFYEEDFARYVVTQKDGGLAVDPKLIAAMQRTASLRAEQKKAATAAETAGKFNGGMNRGRVGPRNPAQPVTPAKPVTPEKVGKQAAWDNVLQSALQEITV